MSTFSIGDAAVEGFRVIQARWRVLIGWAGFNLLALVVRDGTLALDFTDEVVSGTCLTHDGEVRHPPTADALAALRASDNEGVA